MWMIRVVYRYLKSLRVTEQSIVISDVSSKIMECFFPPKVLAGRYFRPSTDFVSKLFGDLS